MNNPLVSIIVPIYNVDKYLKACIESLINQTYKNIEIILINDGSPDRAEEICLSYAQNDSRIVYIKQENQGLSAARNSGMKIAKGEYWLFVDSDDWVALNEVETLVDLAITNNALVATGGYERVKDGSLPNKKIKQKEITIRSGQEYVELMARPMGVFCFAWNRLVHRSLFDNITFPVGYIFEDIFTMPKAIFGCDKVVSTNEILYFYRIRNTSLSHKKFTKKALHEMDAYKDFFYYGKAEGDRKIQFYNALFFVTKYHYYTLKIIANHFSLKEYRNEYKEFASICWKYIFKYLF